jgi:hypothetical protein
MDHSQPRASVESVRTYDAINIASGINSMVAGAPQSNLTGNPGS